MTLTPTREANDSSRRVLRASAKPKNPDDYVPPLPASGATGGAEQDRAAALALAGVAAETGQVDGLHEVLVALGLLGAVADGDAQ